MSRPSSTIVDLPNTLFLSGILVLVLTAVPWYIWSIGLNAFQVALFLFFFIATGLSITLGYHRLFSHRAFEGSWPVRFLSLFFGAAAFENSALCWVSDHRRHHKHADHDHDPYNITKGFFHAHIGWILKKNLPQPELDNVKDLQQDWLVQMQHRYYVPLAVAAGFILPAAIGFAWGGWQEALGGLLIAGVARLFLVHHFTFFINSLCHSVGSQPYSKSCTARDSAIMALFTFGEGYHNFHHAFPSDYRNGVKPWQFDPTKWTIWCLSKLGLARQLRRVPESKIIQCQIAEQQRQLESQTERLPEPFLTRLQAAKAQLDQAFQNWEKLETEYYRLAKQKFDASRDKVTALQQDVRAAAEAFRVALNEWQETHRLVLAQLQAT